MPSDNLLSSLDGQTYVSGGVNSGMSPDIIQADQLAWARNVNLRNGKPETPWGLVERGVLPFGKVQGMKEFSFGDGVLIMSIAGRVYSIAPDYATIAIDEFVLPVQRSKTLNKTFMEETSGFFVLQDGNSTPLILNGSFLRKAADDEIPLGKHMAFDGNRLWFTRGRTLNACDIAIGEPGSELKFLEARTFQGGGNFTLPGNPTGLAFMPSSDGATAFGVLMVFGNGWTLAFKANIGDRSAWLSTPGFKTRVFPNIGCSSHSSIVTSNTDMYWIDGDGEVRNMRQAVSDYDSAGSTSASREIATITEHQSPDYLDDTHSIIFNSKMFVTASPYFVFEDQIGFRDMYSLDYTPVGTQGAKGKPVYDGERDGITTTHLATLTRQGRKRAFAVSKESDGTNRLWEIIPEEKTDIFISSTGDREKSLIESDVIYRTFQFDSNYAPRTFGKVELWLTGIQGNISGNMYYRRDKDEQWYFIDTIDFCTLYEDKTNVDPHVWKYLQQGQRPQIISRTPTFVDDRLKGHTFELRFIIKGVFSVDKVLLFAKPLEKPVHSQTKGVETCKLEPITLVGEEYVIPVVPKTLTLYEDETGATYEDEQAVEYHG